MVNLGRGENAKDLFSHSSTSKDDFLLVHSFALKKMKKICRNVCHMSSFIQNEAQVVLEFGRGCYTWRKYQESYHILILKFHLVYTVLL